MSAFPIFDHSRFKWLQAEDDPSKYIRQITGCEVVVEFFSHNNNDLTLFLCAHIETHIEIPASEKLKDQAREAWANVRRKVPGIAARLEHDKEGTSFISYRIPECDEVNAWLHRTVHIEQELTDLAVLRTKLSDKPVPDQNGDMAWVYLLPQSKTSLGVMVQASHIPFDASAGYIILNHFMREFSNRLTLNSSASSNINAPWGDEVKHLCPCATDVLGLTEVKQGDPRYDQSMQETLSNLALAAEKNYGLRPRRSGGGRTIHLGYTFSAAETASIVSALRKKGFTPNHAAHASVTLLTLRDNPPPVGSDSIISYYAMLNGRQRLIHPYDTRDGFVGICAAISIMKVPVNVVDGPDGNNDKAMAIKIANILKECYQRQKADPALLAVVPQEMEYMFAPLKEAVRNGISLPPWPAPWFSGDGITERYVDRKHVDSTGRIIVDVTECFLSVNRADPAPCFRCQSWRDQLSISIDYNEAAMPVLDMEHIMKEWIRLIRLFVD